MTTKIYFDPVSKGFYQSDIHTTIPGSAIEVSETERLYLLNGQSKNKQISTENGKVILKDKLLDEDDLAINERAWRNRELTRSDIELNKVQDSDQNALGTVTQWRDYRKALRAWPEHKDFPDKESRPVSPLDKE